MENNLIIGVYTKLSCEFLNNPSINGFLADKKTGVCIKADSSDTNIYMYTSPFTLNPSKTKAANEERKHRSFWKNLLVINECFSSLDCDSKVLLFEICDNIYRKDSRDSDKIRKAWAFLVPVASDGSMNTNQEVLLQLFEIRKSCKISHEDCNILHFYTDHDRVEYQGTIKVAVKGILANKIEPNNEDVSLTKVPTDVKPAQETEPTSVQTSKSWPWSRLPAQSCKIPNKRHLRIELDYGVSRIKFSKSGIHFAASTFSQIYVFEVMSGKQVTVFEVHARRILGLEWSPDDTYLLSASQNRRAIVWSLSQKTPVYKLTHPCHVLQAHWFKGNDMIVTSGLDKCLRHWRNDGNVFTLVSETLTNYSSRYLAIHEDYLYCSESSCVSVWEFYADTWHYKKKLSCPRNWGLVNSIHVLSKSRIVMTHSWRNSFLFDVDSEIILKTFSNVNSWSFCQTAVSPCGSLLFTFNQSGYVSICNINTGEYLKALDGFYLDCLVFIRGCVDYHPHEHMIGVSAVSPKHPICLFKYEPESDKENQS